MLRLIRLVVYNTLVAAFSTSQDSSLQAILERNNIWNTLSFQPSRQSRRMSSQDRFSLSGTATQSFQQSVVTPIPTPNPQIAKTASKKKTHPCPWDGCSQMFTCPHNVQQHIREAHTGEKPFQCHLCDSAFTRPWLLHRHLTTKHGIVIDKEESKKRKRTAGQSSAAPSKKRVVEPKADRTIDREQTSSFGLQPKIDPGLQSCNIDNFIFNRITCTACPVPVELFNRDSVLQHNHAEHGTPKTKSCDCLSCVNMFDTGFVGNTSEKLPYDLGAIKDAVQQNSFGSFVEPYAVGPGEKGELMANHLFVPGPDFDLRATNAPSAVSGGSNGIPKNDRLSAVDWTPKFNFTANTYSPARSSKDSKPRTTPGDIAIPSNFTADMSAPTEWATAAVPPAVVIPPNFTANMNATPQKPAVAWPFRSPAAYAYFTQNMFGDLNTQQTDAPGGATESSPKVHSLAPGERNHNVRNAAREEISNDQGLTSQIEGADGREGLPRVDLAESEIA